MVGLRVRIRLRVPAVGHAAVGQPLGNARWAKDTYPLSRLSQTWLLAGGRKGLEGSGEVSTSGGNISSPNLSLKPPNTKDSTTPLAYPVAHTAILVVLCVQLPRASSVRTRAELLQAFSTDVQRLSRQLASLPAGQGGFLSVTLAKAAALLKVGGLGFLGLEKETEKYPAIARKPGQVNGPLGVYACFSSSWRRGAGSPWRRFCSEQCGGFCRGRLAAGLSAAGVLW